MSGWNPHQQKIVDRTLTDLAWLIDHEWVENYVSARPYERPARRPAHRFGGDCTGTIKLVLCTWNNIPSIDGLPLGYGDTRSFVDAPKMYHVPVRVSEWQPLDILLYKHHAGGFMGGPREHATILTHKTKGVWWCFSMGSTPGPSSERWNYTSGLAAVRRPRIPLK